MANILVNGMKSKAGGGKAIFDTYLRLLAESATDDHYYVLTPDRSSYHRFESEKISIVDVPMWAHSNLATIPLYRSVFPRLLAQHRIDAIINFGDVVIPSDVPQLYNFDWAFAVYRNHISWDTLGWKERILYLLKMHFFAAYLPHATIIAAQTDAMKARLEAQYGLCNVVVVPAAVDATGSKAAPSRSFDMAPNHLKLVYPANYYPHKNYEILEPVAELFVSRGIRAVIITTLSEDEHKGARAFLSRCRRKGLDSVVTNVGRLSQEDIPALFDAADALLMPTLLETFGLPYVEAMHYGKPILTSDLDFAHAVCGNAAIYFDPNNPESIVQVVTQLITNDALRGDLTEQGRRRVAMMWNWKRVFGEYQRLIATMLQEPSTPRTKSAR